MLLRYTVTVNDLLAFERYFRKTDSYSRRRRAWSLWGGPFLLLAIGMLYGHLKQDWRWAVGYAALAGLFHLVLRGIYGPIIERRLRTFYSKNKSPLLTGESSLEIKDEGLHRRTSVSESTTSWAGISKLVSTDTHLFVYVGATAAFIVPKNGILEGDYDGFTRLLQERVPSPGNPGP